MLSDSDKKFLKNYGGTIAGGIRKLILNHEVACETSKANRVKNFLILFADFFGECDKIKFSEIYNAYVADHEFLEKSELKYFLEIFGFEVKRSTDNQLVVYNFKNVKTKLGAGQK